MNKKQPSIVGYIVINDHGTPVEQCRNGLLIGYKSVTFFPTLNDAKFAIERCREVVRIKSYKWEEAISRWMIVPVRSSFDIQA